MVLKYSHTSPTQAPLIPLDCGPPGKPVGDAAKECGEQGGSDHLEGLILCI